MTEFGLDLAIDRVEIEQGVQLLVTTRGAPALCEVWVVRLERRGLPTRHRDLGLEQEDRVASHDDRLGVEPAPTEAVAPGFLPAERDRECDDLFQASPLLVVAVAEVLDLVV